jgi:chemotaxis response regulator CheB
MASGRRTRILIVDDSAVMRSLLRSVVGADAGLEVAGHRRRWRSGLERH